MIDQSVSLSSSSLVVGPTGFRPNTIFLGFQLELDQLSQKLANPKRRALGTCAVLLWGPPGCGKSQIAREYLWRRRADYPTGCFWVDCKTRESRSKSFWDIAQAVAVLSDDEGSDPAWNESTKYVDAVRKWLEAREGWLLVFDGLTTDGEDDIDELQPFIADRSGNNIIYTSVDRTLAKRQRLLNPSAVKVFPLSQHDACKLLYRNLDIRSPSELQTKKAYQLVKHYECLPLAIHAAAHSLTARGISLEKFTPGTSDHRLAEPYLEILDALRDHNHPEAVNLITLLSFFSHIVPVALIRFGQPVLQEHGVEIRALESIGSMKKELDNTLAVLIRYGLVERTLLEYCISPPRAPSPEDTRTRRGAIAVREPVVPDDSSSLEVMLPRTDSRQDSASSGSVTFSIDVVTVHTVVQNVLRDELRLRYADQPARYWWWLSLASKLLSQSYAVADSKIKSTEGRGLVRDYRDYDTQAGRLFSHFPKSAVDASPSVRKTRHHLHETLRAIKQEIKNRSPSQSFDGLHQTFQYSVFERANSTSSDSLSGTSLTRTSTWSPEHADDKTESPTQLRPTFEIDGGSEGSWNDRWSELASSGILIPSTNISQSYTISPTEPHATHNSSVLQAIFQGRPSLTKRPKDLGEWKPLPVPPTLSQDQAQVRSRASSFTSGGSDDRTTRPTSTGSEASGALAAIHRNSPPPSRGGRIKSPSRADARTSSEDRKPLAPRSTNDKLSPLATEFQPGKSTELVDAQRRRNPSSSPRLIQTALNNQAATRAMPIPAFDGGTADSLSRSVPLQESRARLQTRPAPNGYSSQPMSRDTSRESNYSLTSAPPAVPGSASLSTSPAIREPYLYSRPGLASIDIIAANRAWDERLAGIGAEMSPPEIDGDIFEPNPGKVVFGGMEPVELDEARMRATVARERSIDARKREGGKGNA